MPHGKIITARKVGEVLRVHIVGYALVERLYHLLSLYLRLVDVVSCRIALGHDIEKIAGREKRESKQTKTDANIFIVITSIYLIYL